MLNFPPSTPRLAMARLPLLICFQAAIVIAGLVAVTPKAHAQIEVLAGPKAERQVIQNVIDSKMVGLILPDSPVQVRILSPNDIEHMVDGDDSSHRAPDNNPGDNQSNGYVDGIYDCADPDGTKAAITLARGERPDDLRETFVHEYGHHIWSEFLADSDRETFWHIYDRQLAAHSLITEYAEDSPQEAFAEAFSYYVLYPKVLAARDPLSYRFMQQTCARLKQVTSHIINDDYCRQPL